MNNRWYYKAFWKRIWLKAQRVPQMMLILCSDISLECYELRMWFSLGFSEEFCCFNFKCLCKLRSASALVMLRKACSYQLNKIFEKRLPQLITSILEIIYNLLNHVSWHHSFTTSFIPISLFCLESVGVWQLKPKILFNFDVSTWITVKNLLLRYLWNLNRWILKFKQVFVSYTFEDTP